MALSQKEWRAEIPLIIAGLIWGSSFVSGKVGVEHADPVLFSLLRYLFAALSIIPILLLFKHFDRKVLSNPIIIGISALNAIAMVMQNIGMTMTTATNAVLLIDINVVYIAILAVFVLNEKISPKLLVGLGLGIFGVLVISTNGNISNIGGGTLEGNLLALGAGLLWAFYVVYLTKTLMRGAELVSATMAIILYTTLILIPLTLISQPSLEIDGTGWAMAIYTGIICTTLAFLLYTYGLRAMGATSSSVILLIEIVFGMLFAIIFLNEMPTRATVLGGLFILLAVVIISYKKKKKIEASPQE